ncbi:MAG: hypothetical protein AYK22_07515 [Thermoplasmatales archaeon SG8-52-3]|nr:MAG: hypothetical protein AYK22_07515 [Thermoplasmatales archaeon SG8-52-3]
MTFEETTFEIIKCKENIARLRILGEWLSDETRKVWSDMGEEMRRLEKLDKNLNYRWHVEGLSQGTYDDRGKDECV